MKRLLHHGRHGSPNRPHLHAEPARAERAPRFSRGVAADSSPRREPWVAGQNGQAPEGRQTRDLSPLRGLGIIGTSAPQLTLWATVCRASGAMGWLPEMLTPFASLRSIHGRLGEPSLPQSFSVATNGNPRSPLNSFLNLRSLDDSARRLSHGATRSESSRRARRPLSQSSQEMGRSIGIGGISESEFTGP